MPATQSSTAIPLSGGYVPTPAKTQQTQTQQPTPATTPTPPIVNPNAAFNNLSPIQTPTPASSLSPTPSLTLPQPNATNVQSSYFGSVADDVQNTQNTLQSAYDQKSQQIQSQLDTLKSQQQQELDAEQQLSQPFQEQLEQTQEQQLNVNSNFQKNQSLADELNSLVTEAKQRLTGQNTREASLDSINAGYNRTLSDITARVGLIQSAMSAYNGQISAAYTQIDRSVAAINADRNDQLNYYQTLLQLNNQGQLDLNDQAKTLAQQQISDLQKQADDAQATADNIKQAMLNPSTAQAYAQAGVTLTDTPEQINQKLSDYSYSQELSNTNNQMAQSGFAPVVPGQTPPAGAQTITITDSRGNQQQYYNTSPKTQIVSLGNGVSQLVDTTNGKVLATFGSAGAGSGSGAPGSSVGSAQLGIVPQGVSTINALVGQGIIDGSQPPTITNSLSGNGFQVKAYLEANGYDLTTASEDWNAVSKWVQTENSATVIKANTAAETASQEITNLQALLANWKSSNFPLLNSAELAAAKSGALGANAKNLATQINDQIIELNSDMASVYRYGNSPTNSSMEQATNTLQQNWSNDQINAALDVLSKNVAYRINSLSSTQNIVSASGNIGAENAYVGGSGSTFQKGDMSDSDFVAAAVQASGHDYSSIINGAPAGEIAVVENSSGTVGYIPVEEFDASQYTRM